MFEAAKRSTSGLTWIGASGCAGAIIHGSASFMQLFVRSDFQSASLSIEVLSGSTVASLSSYVATALQKSHPALPVLQQLIPSDMAFWHAARRLAGQDLRSCDEVGLRHGDTLQLVIEGVGGLRGGAQPVSVASVAAVTFADTPPAAETRTHAESDVLHAILRQCLAGIAILADPIEFDATIPQLCEKVERSIATQVCLQFKGKEGATTRPEDMQVSNKHYCSQPSLERASPGKPIVGFLFSTGTASERQWMSWLLLPANEEEEMKEGDPDATHRFVLLDPRGVCQGTPHLQQLLQEGGCWLEDGSERRLWALQPQAAVVLLDVREQLGQQVQVEDSAWWATCLLMRLLHHRGDKKCLQQIQRKKPDPQPLRDLLHFDEQQRTTDRIRRLGVGNKASDAASSGLRLSLHGNIYQLRMLCLFLTRAAGLKIPFCLATELERAEKFDDLVFKEAASAADSNPRPIHDFLQAKHKFSNDSSITCSDLLSAQSDAEFGLPKYFRSFLQMRKNFQEGRLRHFILCTNIDFFKDVNAKIMLDLSTFEPVSERIEMLSFAAYPADKLSQTPKLWRFRKNFTNRSVLVDALKKVSEQRALASALAKAVCTGQNPHSLSRTTLAFKTHHVSLVQDGVIDKAQSKFKIDFLDGDGGLQVRVAAFRLEFLDACRQLLKKSDADVLTTLKSVTLKISAEFGVPSHAAVAAELELPYDQARDEDVENFLGALVLAVAQPNADVLKCILDAEWSSQVNLSEDSPMANSIAACVEVRMLQWMKAKNGSWLDHNDAHKILSVAQYATHAALLTGPSVNVYRQLLERPMLQPLPSTVRLLVTADKPRMQFFDTTGLAVALRTSVMCRLASAISEAAELRAWDSFLLFDSRALVHQTQEIDHLIEQQAWKGCLLITLDFMAAAAMTLDQQALLQQSVNKFSVKLNSSTQVLVFAPRQIFESVLDTLVDQFENVPADAFENNLDWDALLPNVQQAILQLPVHAHLEQAYTARTLSDWKSLDLRGEPLWSLALEACQARTAFPLGGAALPPVDVCYQARTLLRSPALLRSCLTSCADVLAVMGKEYHLNAVAGLEEEQWRNFDSSNTLARESKKLITVIRVKDARDYLQMLQSRLFRQRSIHLVDLIDKDRLEWRATGRGTFANLRRFFSDSDDIDAGQSLLEDMVISAWTRHLNPSTAEEKEKEEKDNDDASDSEAATLGVALSRMLIVSAEPGMGKSQLVLQLGRRICRCRTSTTARSLAWSAHPRENPSLDFFFRLELRVSDSG